MASHVAVTDAASAVAAAYDVAKIRSHFPALRSGLALFDGPGGSQVPQEVGDAIAAAITQPISNRGTVTESEINAEKIVVDFRQAVADLINAEPKGVVYGRSWTQLTYDFSRMLAKDWRAGDEIIVTNLDHDSNIRPWIQAAEGKGVVIRWAHFDTVSGELPVSAISDLLNERTRLVAVTSAGNTIGTRPDIKAIASEVHRPGSHALLYVDGVHLTPHVLIDMQDLGADFFGFSFYKLMGPHCAVIAAKPELLATLNNDKVLPCTNAVPERFELGTLPYELLAGCTAAVNFIANLVISPNSNSNSNSNSELSRREKIEISMRALEHYEDGLFVELEAGIKALPGVTTYGGFARQRTPTIYFTLANKSSAEVYRYLATKRVNAPSGNFYALEASRALGLGDSGAVRAGLAPYNTLDDVARLLAGLRELVQVEAP